jgi:broad specificity phosphatase PhoE
VAAVVSHNGILRTLLCHFLGMPYRNIFRVSLDFGCLSLVEIYGDGTKAKTKMPVVQFMNYVHRG